MINLGLWNLDIKNTKWPKVVFFKNRVERYSFFDPAWTSMGMNWGQRCLKRPKTICHRTYPVIYFIFLRRNCIAKENTSVPQKMVGDKETRIIKKKKEKVFQIHWKHNTILAFKSVRETPLSLSCCHVLCLCSMFAFLGMWFMQTGFLLLGWAATTAATVSSLA